MNLSLGIGAKISRLALVAAVVSVGVAAQADSYKLTVAGLNQTTSATISPINEDVYITSLNGTLTDTTNSTFRTLGEFYCVDTSDAINVPDSPYAVTVGTATGTYATAATLVTDFSPGYPGGVFNGNNTDLTYLETHYSLGTLSSAQLDSGLQLAIWETVNGITGSSDSSINTIAADMIATNTHENGSSTVTTGLLMSEVGSDGQSMLYVPGIGGPTPSPEPFTMAIGAAGVGMFLVRRRKASK